jgi:hypothetical protein
MASAIPVTLAAAPPARRIALPMSLIAAAILVCASLWLLHSIDRGMPFHQSDLLPRWLGTRLALHGQDPYAEPLLRNVELQAGAHPQPFLYPATIVILLAPLAGLSLEAAQLVFLLIAAPLLALSFLFCMERLQLPAHRADRGLVLLLACVSWPVLWGLRMQQPTLLIVPMIFGAWFLLARGRQIAPGILLALATTKPQLVLPLLVWLLIWAVVQRRWAFLASFAATLALLLGATERLVPGWLPRWRASLQNYSCNEHAAPALAHLFGHGAGGFLTVLLAGAAAIALWSMRRSPARSVRFAVGLSLCLALSLCIFPSQGLMIYNNILLFPGILLLLFQKPAGKLRRAFRFLALAQLALDFLFVPVAALGESLFRPSSFWLVLPFLDTLLPALLIAALLSGLPEEHVAGGLPAQG